LQSAKDQGRLSHPVTWKESRALSFLDACAKEAGRLHPPFGSQYERIVPDEGAEICGRHLKGSTIVGINPWVSHRDWATFGEDAEAWRPGRRLCDEATRRRMEHGLLTVGFWSAMSFAQPQHADVEQFGAGHRSCIGKNISYLEVYKLVPTMLQLYDVSLPSPNAPKTICNEASLSMPIRTPSGSFRTPGLWCRQASRSGFAARWYRSKLNRIGMPTRCHENGYDVRML